MGYNNHFWLVKGMEMKCCDRINRNIVVALSLEGLFFKKRYSGNQSGTVYRCVLSSSSVKEAGDNFRPVLPLLMSKQLKDWGIISGHIFISSAIT